ncbi:hypothetical protein U1Q18_044838 [Sarracenia purpurea var. burkii]
MSERLPPLLFSFFARGVVTAQPLRSLCAVREALWHTRLESFTARSKLVGKADTRKQRTSAFLQASQSMRCCCAAKRSRRCEWMQAEANTHVILRKDAQEMGKNAEASLRLQGADGGNILVLSKNEPRLVVRLCSECSAHVARRTLGLAEELQVSVLPVRFAIVGVLTTIEHKKCPSRGRRNHDARVIDITVVLDCVFSRDFRAVIGGSVSNVARVSVMFSILAGAETEQVARASVLALWPGSDRKRTDANLTCASNFSMTSGAQVTSGSVKSGGKGHQFNGRRSSRNASLASEVIVQLTMPTTEGVTRRPAV